MVQQQQQKRRNVFHSEKCLLNEWTNKWKSRRDRTNAKKRPRSRSCITVIYMALLSTSSEPNQTQLTFQSRTIQKVSSAKIYRLPVYHMHHTSLGTEKMFVRSSFAAHFSSILLVWYRCCCCYCLLLSKSGNVRCTQTLSPKLTLSHIFHQKCEK